MNQAAKSQTQYDRTELSFSKKDFDALAAFALKNFGLSMPESKMPMVYTRLWRRLRARGMDNFNDYRHLIDDPNETEERLALLSALTTNVTRFFREPHHFDTLRTEILPPLIKAAQNGERVRLWSAGCSTGQEPYSIAMCVLEQCPNVAELDLKILGTDIDPQVIRQAEQACYDREELAPVPQKMRDDYVRFESNDTPLGMITDNVRGLVSFGVLNLIEELPFSGPFQVIFCRNVTIYFDKETQSKVWHTFSNVLGHGGYLFAGHSERLSGPACHDMHSVGITTYLKP